MTKRIKHELDDILSEGKSSIQDNQVKEAMRFYNAQPLYTDALARKYPKVPVKDILKRSVSDKTFSNTKLDNVADSLRNKYGDISLNKNEMDSLTNIGYPNIIDINNNMSKADKQVAGYNANTKGVNESSPEAFGYRMLMQRSYPQGSVPYKYLEKADGGNLYFLGGLTGATAMTGGAEVAGGLSGMINTNSTGGAAASGALKGASIGSALGPYGMAAGAVIGGVAGFIGQQNKQARDTFNEQNDSMKERNQLLGIKANGGYILPLGVSPNMTSQYKDGGDLTEFNTGDLHQNNPYQGVPQGVDQNGEQNKVEQGETKWQDYIFSDRLLLDKNMVEQHNLPKSMEGKTFADASKKLSKLIKERPNDPISKNTHSDYMKHLIMANDNTRQSEESSMMANGGNLYYEGAPLKLTKPHVQIDDPDYYAGNMSKMQSLNALNFKSNPQQLEIDKLKNNALSKTKGLDGKTNLGFFRDAKNLRYAPIAFDALAGSGLLGKTPTPEKYDPTLIQQSGRLNPAQIDEMQMRNATDSAFQTGIAGLSEASGGSGSALRAGLSGLNKDYMSSIGSAYSSANVANNTARMQADQFNLGMDANTSAQNAQMINQAELYNTDAANKAKLSDYDTRMSYLGKGAEGLGDIGYEQRMAELMPKLYGYDQYGKYIAPLQKKCGGRLRLKNHKK